MGPDLDLKGKSKIDLDTCPRKDVMAPKEEPMKMTCDDHCEDNSFFVKALPNERTPFLSQNADINIIESINSKGKGLIESVSVSEDATDCSSSFSETDSGVANGSLPSDVEVESELRDDVAASIAFEDFGDLFQTRKKKLTPHWRKFAQPLVWRCKWAELQVRELKSQELKYRRELSKYDKRTQHDLLNFTLADRYVKSTPISRENRQANIIKRKRRKQVKEATDVASYMSQHKLFSYLGKKSCADRTYMDDDFGTSAKKARTNFTGDDFGVDGGWPCLEFKDDNTVEYILQKIDERQSELHMLKARMDKLISENASKFVSNVTVLNPCNTPLTFGPPHIGSSHQKIEDEVLIYHNHFIKEEFGVQPFQQPITVVEEKSVASRQSKEGASPAQHDMKTHPISKLSIPKNKRKRARRRVRPYKYSRRTSRSN